jgi:hypothetical protein
LFVDAARLRAEFRRRTGREFSGSDALLLRLIEETRSRRRRQPEASVEDGVPTHRLSIPLPLGTPEGTGWPEDRAPGRRGPDAGDGEVSPDARPAPPVSELPWVKAVQEAMGRHPSADTREFDRPDLRVVPSEDGEPTYSRHEETG